MIYEYSDYVAWEDLPQEEELTEEEQLAKDIRIINLSFNEEKDD